MNFSDIRPLDYPQRQLSKLQAFPVLGMAVSVPKALLSIAELVTSVALGSFCFSMMFLSVLYLPINPKAMEWFANKTFNCFACAGLAVCSLTYSNVNFFTLGLFGTMIEGECGVGDGRTFRALTPDY